MNKLSNRSAVTLGLLTLCALASGCGLAALPLRVASGTAKIAPVIGDTVAAPLDAAADAID